MDKRLLAAYRFFHERGTMCEGTHGVDALAMARAERWAAETEGVELVCEPEQESYRDVYGEDPPEGVDFYWLAVKVDGEVLASLGMVDDTSGYHRVVFGQLAYEALTIVREREAREAILTRAGNPESAVAAGWGGP